ncbi:hypothetical protein K8Z61_08055 [Nocardioides sp. TRM66260-LWL]|uniref:hypothetical protein n=1 Tax=Nocardioides sp. TRM66260-LWL TaxID=2874478 RepID=UPI001CC662E8|nr:hypothetical protein [Nocardioides sp. TRM66260-LWL]MBZ5734448.1 hypothetical protein [Nocardioides sp. TRM66260-LWL]
MQHVPSAPVPAVPAEPAAPARPVALPPRRRLRLVAAGGLLAGTCLTGALVAGLPGDAAARTGQAVQTIAPTARVVGPAGSTIERVGGDAENGFDIHYYDGTVTYPPTTSEAVAECLEYDTYPGRVKCKAQVLTWYRDLGEMKKALYWARRLGS